jgi:prepilin-type N-terminal cleavage/methylation domain-containing protein
MTNKNNLLASAGFTLLELVIVLTIISIMIVVVLPLSKKSDDGAKIKQHCGNIAQSLRYAIDLSETNNKAVKFVIDTHNRSFYLRMENDHNNFTTVGDFLSAEKHFDDSISLSDIEGFEQDGNCYYTVFNPQNTWPTGRLSFFIKNLTVTIRINSKNVNVENKSI